MTGTDETASTTSAGTDPHATVEADPAADGHSGHDPADDVAATDLGGLSADQSGYSMLPH